MTAKKSKKLDSLKRNWAYIFVLLAVFGVAYFGSLDKTTSSDDTMNVRSIVSSGAQISADQVNQFYMVAEMADSMNLASANLAQTNYDTVALLQQNSQTADDSGKIQKPIAVNLAGISRGVIQYAVKDGENLEAIAARYGITTDQIRWSNGLKTTDVSVGQSLLIPTMPGIAYKVKSGENVDGLADKYKSSAAEIIAVNDLEKDQNLAADTVILIPRGILPETERPEYVVPTTSYSYSGGSTSSASTSYHYAASYASGNKYAYGWCTWYAWQWRHDNMGSNYQLPSNLGNANTWAAAARAAGFNVNRTPAYGAVFQTSAGWLGHVGVVTGVNADGSIVISDMNGIAGWGRVGSKTISAAEAANYTYIHGR
ncbi:LysM peptidoglycan-binding domain-containing protein [Candidatus Saccharibacteria bacterium]|nr:LysM peptidoglycan-binding domain-containing protein [Candidatus Saccharibacteria bacterium]